MNRIVGLALGVFLAGAACAASVAATKASPAQIAIQAAAKQNRYMVATFYKSNDAASTRMLTVAKKLQAKHSDRADFVSIDVGNSVNKDLAAQYGADRSRVPQIVVIAPNGAVTARYAQVTNGADLSEAFVSNGTANVLRILQDGNLAVVCLQSSKTKLNAECTATAEGLSKAAEFGDAVGIVTIDPSDSSEAKLIETLKVDVNSENAKLVVIAQPFRVMGTFDATATLGSIKASLTKALRGGTCGAGGGGSCGCGSK